MDQITIRGIPADVERVIRRESQKSQLSLNKTIINMLRRAVDLAESKKTSKKTKNHDFSKYAGLWTKEEADEIDRIIEEEFEQIDEGMWK